ncbi:MAG: hypothetical protein M3O50_19680 [Myxococcota bacterium]|nr:hypothetical protein [Myxococcota bacterium]
MKPGDQPDFFRRPAPEGRARESSLRLDRDGRFWHDGKLVEHPGVTAALHTWIARHPDDGRYILSNGYDWTYFTVEDAPYFVRALRVQPDRVVLVLSDGTEEAWLPASTRVGDDEALYATVKASIVRGKDRSRWEAKFSRHAQASLAPLLDDCCPPAVLIGGRVHPIGHNGPNSASIDDQQNAPVDCRQAPPPRH